jgi:hypothetical protein
MEVEIAETDVYNADETDLFFKLLPDLSMVLSKDTCRRGNVQKKGTLFFCVQTGRGPGRVNNRGVLKT